MKLVALVAADRNGLTSKLEDVLVTVLRTLQLHSTAQKYGMPTATKRLMTFQCFDKERGST